MLRRKPKLFAGEEPPANITFRDKHDKDKYLRRHGFKIHSRPRVGAVLWERFGDVITEGEALERIESEKPQAKSS